MHFLKNSNFLLGIPGLLPEWKKMISPQYLFNDMVAGIAVACVAIPLSLAIALASGVPPAVGLVTAITGGIVCALFGGTSLAVSGPAAAMSVLLADTVDKFGVQALVFMCLLAGLMQIISGIAGLGKLARYVPLPVVAGFTAGIGVIILIGQLPRIFGLEPPSESHIVDVFSHVGRYFQEINLACLVLVLLTMLIIYGLPKILPKVQPVLPAVIITTAITYFLKLDIPLIGAIPRSLPAPHLPTVSAISIGELFFTAFIIYMLASLETLLSSSAVDKITQEKKHNSDQELIGQGLGNLAVSLFGGIPITGVIARSATNVRVGAKTRRASIFHALVLLLTVYIFAPLLGLIPIAALAGVLFTVAFSMVNYKEFYGLWLTARSEALIYIVTFFTIILVDLLAGVQAGIVASAIIVLFKATQTRLHISTTAHDDTIRLSLTGALTFLSIGKLSNLEKELASAHAGQTVLLDLSHLDNLDTTGAAAIIDLFIHLREKQIKFYIKGLARRFESLFKVAGSETFIDDCYLISEHDLRKSESPPTARSSYGQLVHGVNLFHARSKENDKRLFDYFAERQDPHTLFITCSDSRIVPSNITSSDPGDLFIIRNVGNYIPPYDPANNVDHSEFAALEFSLLNLDVTDIVVCGHANCGAMKACQQFQPQLLSPKLRQWISKIRTQLEILPAMHLNEISQRNVLNQLENLKTYPFIQDKLARDLLTLHAWFFEFDHSMVYEWDTKTKKFHSLIGAEVLSTTKFNLL